MTETLQLQVPSNDQIAAAIYETVLRPELSDRFCREQQTDPIARPSPLSSRANPILQAPHLQAHFGRALEILEQQWRQNGRPAPIAALRQSNDQNQGDGRENTTAQWLVLDHNCQVLEASDGCKQMLRLLGKTTDGIRAWLQLTDWSRLIWRDVLQRTVTQQFSWRDIWVLETSSPGRKLMCRPIWSGSDVVPVAIMIEVIDLALLPEAETFTALTFALKAKENAALWEALRGQSNAESCSDQLQLIAAKAGAPGAAEMIRLVCLLLRDQATDTAIRDGRILPPSFEIRGKNGEVTQCFRMGAETGQPVIFLHGMMDGIAGIQRMQSQLRRAGFRVYAPMRGGYGSSQPVPDTDEQVQACVAQIEALIEQNNLQRPILLGHRSGAVYARAAALRLRERVGGVLGVAPIFPRKKLSDYATLRGHQRALAIAAKITPSLLPVVLKSWSRSIRRRGAATLVRRQADRGSRAMQQINQISLDPVLSLSHDLMMQQHGIGFLADLRLTASDWRSQLIGHGGATVYLCGGRQSALRQDSLYPGVMGKERMQIRICGEMGNVLLYTGPELVISALEELSTRERIPQASAAVVDQFEDA